MDPLRFRKEVRHVVYLSRTLVSFLTHRRMCPGRHLALASVWITLVTTLAAFNITKSKDENGVEIDVTDEFSNALVR